MVAQHTDPSLSVSTASRSGRGIQEDLGLLFRNWMVCESVIQREKYLGGEWTTIYGTDIHPPPSVCECVCTGASLSLSHFSTVQSSALFDYAHAAAELVRQKVGEYAC